MLGIRVDHDCDITNLVTKLNIFMGFDNLVKSKYFSVNWFNDLLFNKILYSYQSF